LGLLLNSQGISRRRGDLEFFLESEVVALLLLILIWEGLARLLFGGEAVLGHDLIRLRLNSLSKPVRVTPVIVNVEVVNQLILSGIAWRDHKIPLRVLRVVSRHAVRHVRLSAAVRLT